MKLNHIEKALMNNPIRAFVQRHHEAAMMEKLGGRCEGQKVLEIGCGRGVGTEVIFERFGAQEVHAFDIDPNMIDKAEKRLGRFSSDRLRLFVGDAEKIDADDQSYDAVFDFGIIHHCPNWQKAVSEVARVLRPNGKFFFEEVTTKALNRWFYRTFLDHPRENRFSGEQFIDELEKNKLSVGNRKLYWFLNDLVVGVGHKS